MKKTLLVLIAVFLSFSIGYAQDLDDMSDKDSDIKLISKGAGEDKDVTFSIHGYVQGNFVVARNDDKKLSNKWNTSKYEFLRAGGVLQLELEGDAYKKAHFYANVRLEYNAVGQKSNYWELRVPQGVLNINQYFFDYYADFKRNEINKTPEITVREAYVDLYGKHVTFRAGQQIISWGEIEGVEAPTDILCPWDLTTVSTVFEDSRLSITAAKLDFDFAKQKLEFVWIPLFQPAKIPEDRFWLLGANRLTRPRFEVRNSEYATRLSGALGNSFKYAMGFLYGFDDLPDSNVRVVGSYQSMMGFTIFIPSVVDTELVYQRVMVPTFDMNVQIGEVLSWKTSANMHYRKDHAGYVGAHKNSTVTYLTGIESSNIFAKIYMALNIGQHWVINYTPVVEYGDLAGLITKLNAMKMPNVTMLERFDQFYPYRYIISGVLQRSFMENDALDIQVRFAAYADPSFIYWDYVVSPNIVYKFTSGVSITVGAQFANRLNEDKHVGILEVRYTF